MKMRLAIFSFVFILTTASTVDHPLKMSFSYLDIGTNGIADIETRIFLDDLSAHIAQVYSMKEIDFSSVESEGTKALQRYLKHHLYFEQGEEKIDIRIDSVSLSENEIALVVNSTSVEALNTSEEIKFTNTILCDAFPMQVNKLKYFGNHYQSSFTNPDFKLVRTSSF